jgi:formylglycine-generating enzyme required for sulfatase activity
MRRIEQLVAIMACLAASCSDTGQPSLDSGNPSSDLSSGVPGTWVTVKKGTYTQGYRPGDPCGGNDASRQVTLTRDFEIQTTEVTQEQFEGLLGYNPTFFPQCGKTCPMEKINWHEAVAYCNALSKRAGLQSCYACTDSGWAVTCKDAPAYADQKIYDCPGYRLPTDGEWEYAYRAGTTTDYYSGNGGVGAQCGSNCWSTSLFPCEVGWCVSNSGKTTHPVAQKAPNAWGLYDMAGNVQEWCHDRPESYNSTAAVTDPWGVATSTSRVLRGGSYNTSVDLLRAAWRFSEEASGLRRGEFGFRCVRTMP